MKSRVVCFVGGAKDTEMQGPGADRPGFEAGARAGTLQFWDAV
jgi:hypothetical protein